MSQLYSIREHNNTGELHVFESYENEKHACKLKSDVSICGQAFEYNTTKLQSYQCITKSDVVLKSVETLLRSNKTGKNDIFCGNCSRDI